MNISKPINFLLILRYPSIYLFVKYFESLLLNINKAMFINKDIKKIHKQIVKIHNNILIF